MAKPGTPEVRVTSRAELRAALRRAERIVVEGDANLAAYAAGLTGERPRAAAPPAEAARLRPIGSAERAAHVDLPGRAPRLWPWILGAGTVAAAGTAAVLLERISAAKATIVPVQAHLPPAPPPIVLAHQPAVLLGPVVLVAVLLALFFVARRMMVGGHGAAPGWRVAEAAQGRVVIDRVRRPG